jgi:hypothetical protein
MALSGRKFTSIPPRNFFYADNKFVAASQILHNAHDWPADK